MIMYPFHSRKLSCFQAEDVIRDYKVTGVQTCALPIYTERRLARERVWMVDPLDGTKGFIAGTGDFAVQIGLAVKGSARLGVLYAPATDVLYWARSEERRVGKECRSRWSPYH